jgi:shikimate dehydrogenase
VTSPAPGGAPSLPSRLVLLGHPLGHTLSPAFQNAALRAAGIPLTYSALDVPPEKLGDTLEALILEGAAGNVTVPHKPAVAARCDDVSLLAARAGAVNTWYVEETRLVGHNTDVGGFDRAARELLDRDPSGLEVAVIGAGGAAAGVLTAIETWPGARARVWNRSPERATTLADRFDAVARAVASLDECLADAALVVNATSLGLRDDDPLPAAPETLSGGTAVLDLVYRPRETAWVRAARARGHRAADGLAMLIEQGALAFERWFGMEPDRAAMWAAVGGRRSPASSSTAGH